MWRVCIVGLLAGGLALSGAELSIPNIAIAPGAAAVGGLRFAAQGSQVAAFQVDILYDAEHLKVSASAGPAASAKEKLVDAAEVAPGRKRIMLMGFNRSVLADGVVVSLLVSSVSGEPGSHWLRLADVAAADADGNLVPVATIDGVVTIGDGAGMPQVATFGQMVSGGDWKTTLTLVNVAAGPTTAKVNFWGGDGQPLVLPLAFPGPEGIPSTVSSSLECVLQPGAILVVETEAPEATETVTGWAELQSPDSVHGYAVLRWKAGPERVSEAMLAFEQRQGQVLVLPYDNISGFLTGVAIANQSPDSPADVTLLLRDEAGAVISVETFPLPARGHTAFVASERFPVLSGRRGTFQLQSNSVAGITVLGLRFNPAGSFTSIPVISKKILIQRRESNKPVGANQD